MLTILATATTAPGANTNYAPSSHRPKVARVEPKTGCTFEVGKTYWTRSICDHDCIFQLTVAKRTAKTIVTTEGKRLRISVDSRDRNESVMPFGRYSMAACISADREMA